MGKRSKNNNKSNKINKRNKRQRLDWPVGLVTVPRSSHGIADATRVTLNYVESGISTALSGYVTYRANDIFDPQATTNGFTMSGNQQPAYRDTWAIMYSRYRVLASTISVRVVNDPSNTIPIFIEVGAEDVLATTTNAVQASVERYATSRVYPSGVSTMPILIQRRMSTARMNGISENAVLVEENRSALVGSSPGDPWYWEVRYSAVDFTTTAKVWVFIHITMDVLFTDPQSQVQND